jgi:hypothetical protein
MSARSPSPQQPARQCAAADLTGDAASTATTNDYPTDDHGVCVLFYGTDSTSPPRNGSHEPDTAGENPTRAEDAYASAAAGKVPSTEAPGRVSVSSYDTYMPDPVDAPPPSVALVATTPNGKRTLDCPRQDDGTRASDSEPSNTEAPSLQGKRPKNSRWKGKRPPSLNEQAQMATSFESFIRPMLQPSDIEKVLNASAAPGKGP